MNVLYVGFFRESVSLLAMLSHFSSGPKQAEEPDKGILKRHAYAILVESESEVMISVYLLKSSARPDR